MWFVLNYVPISLANSRKKAADWVDSYNASNHTNLQLFAPTFFVPVSKNGRKEIIRKPLVYHYVFLNGDFQTVKDFCTKRFGFSFVITNQGDGHKDYAVLSDKEMENFRKIALYYSNSLPFYPLDNVDLEDGDLVRVVEGPFAGLEGYFFPKARSAYGRIVLQIAKNIGTAVFDVSTKYIQIIQFSKNSKTKYHVLERFIPKFLEIEKKHNQGIPLDEGDVATLALFIRRMSLVRMDHRSAQEKLSSLLLASARLVGDAETESLILSRLPQQLAP